MSLHASAIADLVGWNAPNTGQDALRHTMVAFLAARADGCLRECAPGHVTASALVLDADASHVLLTLHPRVGRWVQLGGHCEPADVSLRAAALREAREESGVEALTLDGAVLHLDTHPITCSGGVPTRHLDVRYLVRAQAGARIVRSEESVDLRWWPVDALPETAHSDTIADLVHLGLQRVSAPGGRSV